MLDERDTAIVTALQEDARATYADVAARVLNAIRNDELYIFSHPNMREFVDGRFAAIQAAMEGVTANS